MRSTKQNRSRRSEMSQKSGKRHRKKTDEISMDSSNEEKVTNNTNGSAEKENGDDSDMKGFTIEEVEKSVNASDKSEEKTEGETEKKEEVLNENATVEESAKNTENCGETQDTESAGLDVEELELQFDEDSDKDSNKESPASRCMTRRSHFRNIPTPKTPKSLFEQNGDDKESEKSETPQLPEKAETNGEDTPNSVTDTESKLETDSIANLSTCAVAGDVLSEKDLDLTLNDTSISVQTRANQSDPMINPYKEKSLGETLRGISSRRTIRTGQDYRKYAMKSNMEKINLNDKNQILMRSSVERISGLKRKNDSESPERTKKTKPNSPGLLSYITSPIGQLRTRFMKNEVNSSTPKLTGFKEKEDNFENVELSQIEVENGQKEHTKWCSIM